MFKPFNKTSKKEKESTKSGNALVYIGKVKKLNKEKDQTLEDWCKGYYNRGGITELEEYYEGSWYNFFLENTYDTHVIADDEVYEILTDRYYTDPYVSAITVDDKDCLSFIIRFNTEEIEFNEALQKAIEDYHKQLK